MDALDNQEREAWLGRLRVVGKAQARYLWILLIAGIFFLAVHFQVVGQAGSGENTVVVPLVDLELSALPIWALGLAVIAYILLMVMGSLKAYGTAAKTLNIDGFGQGEAYDLNPNALDFAAYTTKDSWRWLKQLLPLQVSVGSHRVFG